MPTIETAISKAEGYLAEISATAEIRRSYSDLMVAQAGVLYPAFSHDKEAKTKLTQVLQLIKKTDSGALHRGLVIQVHAVFEQFVRDFVVCVVQKKSEAVEKYSDLPEPFQNNHLSHSGTVLSWINKGNVAGQPYNFSALRSNLALCLGDQPDYKLNADAFTILMGNCTPERLEKLFERLGLPAPFSPALGGNSNLKKSLKETKKASVARMARTKLDTQINLRNTIVHGDLSPAITHTDLTETVAFFAALMYAFRDLVA